MPRVKYRDSNFRDASLVMIGRINEIIDSYEARGFTLTLRQLYYQLVARGVIPNNERSYKNLGSLLNDARLAGLVDWLAIEDRTRNLVANPHWDEPGEIIESAAASYAINKWEGQKYRVEVWVEKDALVGVVGRICGRLDVPYFSCRGYTSQSEMWVGAMRLKRHIQHTGQHPVVLHLGDHDPSGIDMSRDIQDRLGLFVGRPVKFRRLALNMDQVERYNPPPNPAKITDSRAASYIAEHGGESWELDALEPEVIAGLIEENVAEFREQTLWDRKVKREELERRELTAASKHWQEVSGYMREEGFLSVDGADGVNGDEEGEGEE